MKQKIKGLLLAMCMMITMVAIPAEAAATSLTEDEMTSMKQGAVTLIEQVTAFTDEEMETYLAYNDEFTTTVINSWQSVKDELGAYQSVGSQEVTTEGDIVTVVSEVEFENGSSTVSLDIDMAQQAYTSMEFAVGASSMSGLMGQAALNTLIGIGTVIAILLFLTFLISLFKYIPRLEQKFMSKETESVTDPEEVLPLEEDTVEDELYDQDHGELAAVIAAAIAASENTSTDGFIVRSIKKSNRRISRV